jgi:hypothetical protein
VNAWKPSEDQEDLIANDDDLMEFMAAEWRPRKKASIATVANARLWSTACWMKNGGPTTATAKDAYLPIELHRIDTSHNEEDVGVFEVLLLEHLHSASLEVFFPFPHTNDNNATNNFELSLISNDKVGSYSIFIFLIEIYNNISWYSTLWNYLPHNFRPILIYSTENACILVFHLCDQMIWNVKVKDVWESLYPGSLFFHPLQDALGN